jgi:hypothetical protein
MGCARGAAPADSGDKLVGARPGAALRLDLEGPSQPFGARVLPARVWSDRVLVTYMEGTQGVMRRAELVPFEEALTASNGMVQLHDARVPPMWREDPGYRLLAPGGAQPARLMALSATEYGRGVDTVYHVLERPAGLVAGITLAVLTPRERQPLWRPAAPLILPAEQEAIERAALEALRDGDRILWPDGQTVEVARARLGAGWHTLALAQAMSGQDGTEVRVALLAFDSSTRQRRALLGPVTLRGWERWSLLAVTDVDSDGFAEVLIEQGSAGRGQLVLVHTRQRPAPDQAPSPYNLCPDLEAGPAHIFYCLALGVAPPEEAGEAPTE